MPTKISNLKSQISNLGFTLIEMLVVISIIGILSVLIAANLNAARSRARDAERKSDLKNISTALRIYYNDFGIYPPGSSSINGCGTTGKESCSWGDEWSAGTMVYMQTLPKDPLSDAQDYQYIRGTVDDATDTDSYFLKACLENKSDVNGIAADSGFTCPSGWMFQLKP